MKYARLVGVYAALALLPCLEYAYLYLLHEGKREVDYAPLALLTGFILWRYAFRLNTAALALQEDFRTFRRNIIAGVFEGLAMGVVTLAALVGTRALQLQFDDVRMVGLVQRFTFVKLMLATAAVAFGAEFLYRGVANGLLKTVNPAALSFFMSSALFAFPVVFAPKADPWPLLNLFLLGFVLSVRKLTRGSLVAVVGIHAGWLWVMIAGQVAFGKRGTGYALEDPWAAVPLLLFVCLALYRARRARLAAAAKAGESSQAPETHESDRSGA